MRRRTTLRTANGFSLIEVLVAAFVLTAAFIPLVWSFLTSGTSSGEDVREVEAVRLAEELMENIVEIHKIKRVMLPLPDSNKRFLRSENEVDIEALIGRYVGELGAPLYASGTSMMGSRMHLTPTRDGFHRYLSINWQARGQEPRYLSRPALLGVTVRVHYTVPRTTGVVHRDVRLASFLHADSMPPRTGDDDKITPGEAL